jgi:hypothetical protein
MKLILGGLISVLRLGIYVHLGARRSQGRLASPRHVSRIAASHIALRVSRPLKVDSGRRDTQRARLCHDVFYQGWPYGLG